MVRRMKAIAIDRFGAGQPLQIRELPDPAVGADDVLIEVHAASVNPVDFKIRDGKLKQLLKTRFPLIMGNDLSGVVKAVGANVTAFAAGDEVYARVEKERMGAWAELCAVHQRAVAKKPKNLTHVEAASLPLVGLTAYQALASARNQVLLKELGCDVPIDYAKEKFEEKALNCDAVLDTLGEETLLASLRITKPGGVVVSIASMPDEPTAEKWNLGPVIRLALRFMNRKITAQARARGVTYRYLFMDPSGEQLARIAALVEAGKIRALVDKTFPLAEAGAAVAAVESGRTRGKVVLQVR
jgi:NADPH:quinone reductase-like Zn-dependent oxidoreductase